MSRHPEIKWAEREDKVYLTVVLPDAKTPKVHVDPEGTFTFTATAGADNNAFEVKLNLLDKINVEECKINIGVRSIFCVLEKAEKKWWTKLLRGDEKTPHYVKVDWDKWVDEDDDSAQSGGPSDLDMGGMDFSKLGDMGGMMGGMGGMGGMMGGMGGMGGMGDMMGGMGGMGDMMGGMGGMGGMMGGMGGFGENPMGEDFDDSDDEEIAKPEEKGADGAVAKGEVSKDKTAAEEAKGEALASS